MCCLLTLYPLLLSQPLSGWKWKHTWLCSTQTSTTPESFDLPCFDRPDFCAQGHHWNWHNNTENQNKLDWKIIQNALAWYAYHTRNWFCPISTNWQGQSGGIFPQLSYCSHVSMEWCFMLYLCTTHIDTHSTLLRINKTKHVSKTHITEIRTAPGNNTHRKM